jgi:hypothetical protein
VFTDTATEASGAVVSLPDSSWDTPGADLIHLTIPGAGIDADVRLDGTAATLSNGQILTVVTPGDQYPYVVTGRWNLSSTSGGQPNNFGYFAYGYQTPVAAMPATGSASYAGAVLNTANFAPEDNQSGGAFHSTGNISFTVNFATGAVTGSIFMGGSGIDSTVTGNFTGAVANAGFSGTMGVEYLGAPTRGPITARFYGPAAEDVGGTFDLTGTDSDNAVARLVGSFQAATSVFPGFTSPAVQISAPATPTVGAPAPTNAATGLELASAGGPNFSTSGPVPPSGTVFAVTQTALTIQSADWASPTYVTADSAAMASGATVTVIDGTQSEVKISIPGLGVSQTVDINSSPGGVGSPYVSYEVPLGNLDYVLLGRWSVGENGPIHVGEAVGGYQTPPGSMPTSGSATYSLTGGVSGLAIEPGTQGGSSYTQANLKGDASLTANFATGQVTGSFTNMVATPVGASSGQAWNNVSVTASISGTAISGTTATSSTPSGSLAFASASGTLKGGFYGPSADEVGAVWTLFDGSKAAIGTVGAHK